MKRFILISLAFVLTVTLNAQSDWFGIDKAKHIVVSTYIFLPTERLLHDWEFTREYSKPLATVVTLGFGAYKEFVMDSWADPKDLMADFVGIGIGYILSIVIDKLEYNEKNTINIRVGFSRPEPFGAGIPI